MKKEEQILEYLRQNKPKGINEIVKYFHWSRKNKDENREYMNRLEESGKVIKIKGDKYTIPEKRGLYFGEFDMVRRNFGFVDTDDGSIYIARRDFENAMSGDKVFVEIYGESESGKKREGKIVKVIKRGTDKVTGVYEASTNFGFVKPRENFGKDIYVSKRNTRGAKTGELVLVEIVAWGNKDKKPEGKIIEVLGDAYDSDVLIEALIKREGYSEQFSEAVVKETQKIDEPNEAVYKNRIDLRKYDLITIDGDDAKDLDDAVYVEEMENGNYKLIVSIADVAHYVKEDSELDKEALKRGNSVYLVDRVIPMFPRKLSNGICSLNEGVDRLAFTAEMIIDKTGKIIEHSIYKSIIKVLHRMTYKSVNKILDDEEVESKKYAEIKKMLNTMKDLAQILRNKRSERGSIDFELGEIKVVLNEEKKVDYIKKRERGEAERIIEDFMIAANETVAEKVFWMELPFVYRIHEKPDIDRIKQLNEFLEGFGYKIPNIDELHPGKIQKIVEEIKDKNYKMVLNKMILMSLRQAKYTTENLGHFGLASNYYTHFTSPIRRYSDLLVHRVLSEIIEKYPNSKRIKKIQNKLEIATDYISKTERKAMKAEEESIKIKVVEYMIDKVGEEFNSVITGMTQNCIFVELDNYVEALIDNFGNENYFFDKKKYKLLEKNSNREYNIGDSLKVLVIKVSMDRMSVEVTPIEGDGR